MTPDTPADGEALYDDRTRPLLLQQAETRGAEDWRHEDAEAVIARLLAKIDSLSGALIPRPAEPAQAAQVDVMVNLYVELENLLAVYSEPDKQLCCDGHMCGCHGATEYQQAEHYAKAALDEARDIIAAAQEGRE